MLNAESPEAACCASPALAPPLVQPQQEAELASLAKALGHPARIRIMRALLAQDSCIAGDLQTEVGLAASTVSQHLKSLKDAGWVQGEVDGPRRCYCINPNTRERFQSLLGELL
ncbi:MAG: winged helix-turn-helix transcriptional regulator [Planctomycetes bacterium]|nr:winged helix-turn-helix transcriptional regulator [Planctomycetota bacterium]MCP4771912.1 winged helix-turn-helix transcriptional regulator [Planctomycetota bacterium]MCP4859957.1 winged helix-turn-helix transcriptional regulator [Planctomycetota bacterium]